MDGVLEASCAMQTRDERLGDVGVGLRPCATYEPCHTAADPRGFIPDSPARIEVPGADVDNALLGHRSKSSTPPSTAN
jgi:hypothetical protein